MCAFWVSPELWANIIGGVVTAVIVGLLGYVWNYFQRRRKHEIVNGIIEIMSIAVKHRNVGEAILKDKDTKVTQADKDSWVRQAEEIEKYAKDTAYDLSLGAGALIEWLDRVPVYDPRNEVEKWVSFLSKVIERTRTILEHNI